MITRLMKQYKPEMSYWSNKENIKPSSLVIKIIEMFKFTIRYQSFTDIILISCRINKDFRSKFELFVDYNSHTICNSVKESRILARTVRPYYVLPSETRMKAILIVYVDDIILTGDNILELERLKKNLPTEFEIKDLGQMRYFLGMELARSKKGISVSQRKYVLDLLTETCMLGCKSSDTPIDQGRKGEDTGKSVEKDRYQRLVGKLIYLSHTRPDIAFAVSVVSQYLHSPKEAYLEAVYRILRYLKGTPGNGLFFKKNERKEVEVFTDADWAGSLEDRRSTTGYCTFVWGNSVT
ncbi:uncharacterized protein LOC111384166 [Olea europaea var. sylvestris]|uniref:uncharacterized protein LOC111384166 n=1 Tax=Olea europaea var. sylvestris TaxID=158386 RepID=UPI000C1D1B4F|nr:uncharacterized protein LOC111384166 [Olea europaea var. sylvestris]